MNMEFIKVLSLNIINIPIIIFLIKKISGYNLKNSKMKNVITFLISVVINSLICLYMPNNIKFLLTTLVVIIFSCIMFEGNINKIIFSSILEQIIVFISEFVFIIFLTIFFNDIAHYFIENSQNYILNFSIFLISALLIKTSIFQKILKYFFEVINNITNEDVYFMFIASIFIMNIGLAFIYLNINNRYLLLSNIVFLLLYSIIIFKLLSEKSKNIKYVKENKNLIISLNEYEKILDYQKINNHENKNQLLVIKSLIERKDKKVLEYIDEIIDEKREDDKVLFNLSKRIPNGGLQGLIYQKMLLMKENNITLDLNISDTIKKINYDNISTKINYDVCKCVGILLDNSIEEAKKTKKKQISVSIYLTEFFIIEISNYFNGICSLDDINKKGYTTKGKNHGYGLNLLKKIIDNNKNIKNETMIINDIFIQKLKVSI